MKYFKKLEGEKVYLSPINLDDYETYVKWLNNPRITQFLSTNDSLITLSNEKELLEKIANEEFTYAIVRKEDDTLLGNVGLLRIDYKDGKASLGIFIGEEVMQELLKHIQNVALLNMEDVTKHYIIMVNI